MSLKVAQNGPIQFQYSFRLRRLWANGDAGPFGLAGTTAIAHQRLNLNGSEWRSRKSGQVSPAFLTPANLININMTDFAN
jgi:hypothetical protein